MEQHYRFSKNHLLRYQHIPSFRSGEQYILVIGSIYTARTNPPNDFALRAVRSRDGLEAFRFNEEALRTKKNDKDLHWRITAEDGNTVSLWSEATKRYLNMDAEGAFLSKKKQCLSVVSNGTFFRFYADVDGVPYFLSAATRNEAKSKLSFTSVPGSDRTSFALLQRVFLPLSVKTEARPILTAGTYADVHIDYGLQTKAPYLRKSILKTARKYRENYDLDVLIMCGDNMSDNASPETQTGAAQGF